MRKAFISYARANRPDVEQLVEHLRELGCDTWVDSSLHGGQDWWQEILRRIADCDVFIPIISYDALNSVACSREFDWAEALGKPVLPVAIEPPPVALPGRLSRRQHIDYSKPGERDRAARRLGGGLLSLPPAPPLPRPAPPPPAAPLSYLTDLVDLLSRPQPLHPEQQRQILVRLRPALRSLDPEERRGGRAVLDRVGSRAELTSDVERSIIALKKLNNDATPTPQPRPPAPLARPVQQLARPETPSASTPYAPSTRTSRDRRPDRPPRANALDSRLGLPATLLLFAAFAGVIPPMTALHNYASYPFEVWYLQTLSRVLLGIAFCILAAKAVSATNNLAAFSGWTMLLVVIAYSINDVVVIKHFATYGEYGPDRTLHYFLRVYVGPSLLGVTALLALLFGAAVMRAKPAAWAWVLTLWGVCGLVEAILSYVAKVDGGQASIADKVLIVQCLILFLVAVLMSQGARTSRQQTQRALIRQDSGPFASARRRN